jgi:hypothetical protein
MDISEISGGPIKGVIGVITSGDDAAPQVTAGWSGLDFVFDDCAIHTIPGGYSLHVGNWKGFARLTLISDAREVPLTISFGEGEEITRWIGFPSHMGRRRLAIDLAQTDADTILIRSDSTFSLSKASVVHLGSIYAEYQLIHDTDMHIYENFAAVEKGICIDKTLVNREKSDDDSVLALAAMDELGGARCGRCRIVSYEPERVVLEVSAERDCYLIFQDMYYPGWNAYVDSEPSHFIRADVGLRALDVPEGEHTVVMEFKPRSLKIGLTLTCLGLLLTLVYAWRAGSRPEQSNSSEKSTA